MSFPAATSDAVKPEVKESVNIKAVASISELTQATKRDWRFWMIFAALSVTGLLTAIEATVASNALPTIVHDLNLGENYVWIVNVYFLTRYG